MKLIYFFLLAIVLLTSGCHQVCPELESQDMGKFRDYVGSLDGRFRFRELWIDGRDSSALLDSLHMRNEIFKTKNYDKQIIYYPTSTRDCPIFRGYKANYSNSGSFKVAENRRKYFSMRFKSVNNKPGFLEVDLDGSQGEYKPDLTFNVTYRYRPAYFKNIIYAFSFSDERVTFSRNYEGREIKLLIY